jgi:hypothetical protein
MCKSVPFMGLWTIKYVKVVNKGLTLDYIAQVRYVMNYNKS